MKREQNKGIKMQLLDTLDEALQPFMDLARYETGSIFSKKVKLEYRGISRQPQLGFKCLTDEDYSFNIHDLQMSDEFIYWHGAAKRDKPMTFEGHVNYLYKRGVGALRGFMTVDENPWKLGLYVVRHQIIDVLTEKQRTKNMAPIMSMIMLYTNELTNDDTTPDDAA